MFKLVKAASYSWPVKFETPKSGGGYEKHSIDIEFKRLEASRLKEALKSEEATDLDFCKEIIVGWSGVVDGSGEAIAFSESALRELLEVPGVAAQIVRSYLESIAGAKAKN